MNFKNFLKFKLFLLIAFICLSVIVFLWSVGMIIINRGKKTAKSFGNVIVTLTQ